MCFPYCTPQNHNFLNNDQLIANLFFNIFQKDSVFGFKSQLWKSLASTLPCYDQNKVKKVNESKINQERFSISSKDMNKGRAIAKGSNNEC